MRSARITKTDDLLPYVGINQQVQRVRFYLLNSTESPRKLVPYLIVFSFNKKSLPETGKPKQSTCLNAPCVGLNQQVQRVRFCLLNSIESPCIWLL